MPTFGDLFYPIFVNVFYHKRDLADYLAQARIEGKRIGLVPTMGALHPGHLSLLAHIKEHCDICVCSVFVNPTQFNNAEDLAKYPRPIQEDLNLLQENGCDIVFMPAVEEMYGEKEAWAIDLGELDTVLEGAFRPGHYQGVTQIVHKLFALVQPDIACFGQKDYQQYLIIKEMVKICALPVFLLLCPTVREPEGLAMSSRNVRLSNSGKKQALSIYQALRELPSLCQNQGIDAARERTIEALRNTDGFTLEYFDVCHPETLRPEHGDLKKGTTLVALVAVWLEGVRLIDNIIFEG